MSSPKSLYKAEEVSLMAMFESFLLQHATILLPILFMVLLFLIIALAVAVMDITSAHNVLVLDSGNYYNHLQDVIE